ncbi:hypothetical protein Agub_g1869, partial [Astrephomene gubernaculifera]
YASCVGTGAGGSARDLTAVGTAATAVGAATTPSGDGGGGSAAAAAASTEPSPSLQTSSTGMPGLPSGFSQPSPAPPLPPPPPQGSSSAAAGAAGGLRAGLWSPAAAASGAPMGASAEADHSQQHTPRMGAGPGEAASSLGLSPSPFQSAAAAAHPASQPGGVVLATLPQHQQPLHGQQQHHAPLPSPPRGGPAARALRTSERDVLLVLTSFCRLASREAGVTEIDKYLTAGKLLALELVVKVLQNPIHHGWENVREEFVRPLHQPLCLALLRNSSPADPPAFGLALRLLTALLMLPKLRRGLKAELGAFYPLLLLRPLEGEQLGPPELPAAAACLPCLAALAGEAALLVDLFVNYDCDLRAPNLFERSVQALSRLSQRSELDGPPAASAPKQQEQSRQLTALREGALRSLLAVVHCLDAWAGPLKEAAGPPAGPQLGSNGAAAAGGGNAGGGEQPQQQQGEEGKEGDVGGGGGVLALRMNGGGGNGGGGGGADASEAQRFEAAKVTKSSLSRGMALFNGGSPVKAMRFLIASGLVESSPVGAAVFLRAHVADLDPAALGEYLGHHEDFELAAMRAYVDMERYTGMTIDAALRSFLSPFRLPGEAQKIDRLMEAFAERFVADNPGVFRTADAAYVLAFAIIMLNTDAHNP